MYSIRSKSVFSEISLYTVRFRIMIIGEVFFSRCKRGTSFKPAGFGHSTFPRYGTETGSELGACP